MQRSTAELLGHDTCGGFCQCGAWYREPAQAGADTVDKTYDIPAQADAEMSGVTPDTNLGTATTITIDGGEGATDPEKDGFFRFIVKNFVSITSMTLRLNVTNGSTDGPRVWLGSDAWSETGVAGTNAPGLTFNNAPWWSRILINDAGNVAVGWWSTPVTGIPLRNGVYSFYLDGTSNDGTIIRSRENSQSRPVLRVVGRKNPTPTSCVSWDTPSQVGSLPSPPSGTVFGSSLTASHLNVLSGNYYTMGDGGSPPDFGRHNFYEISNTGFLRTEYAMFDGNGASLNAFDAEDIQIGPGPEVVTDYVYIGDIGDNGRQRGTGDLNPQFRPQLHIFRTKEQVTPSTFQTVNTTMEVLTLTYPNGTQGTPMHLNAEAFIIDPFTGSLFVIEKPCGATGGNDNVVLGRNRIFKLDAPLPFGSTATLVDTGRAITLTADTSTSCDGFASDLPNQGSRVTGAAVSLDGDRLAVTTYAQNFSWRRPADTTVDFVLSQTATSQGFRCSAPTAAEAMREAISFPGCNQVDGSGYVRSTSDNQTSAPIFRAIMSF